MSGNVLKISQKASLYSTEIDDERTVDSHARSNKLKKVVYLVLVIGLVMMAGTVKASQEKECFEMVNGAAAAFKEKGTDYALKLINATTGPYRKGELYVFAISSSGNIPAHPVNRDLIGRNQLEMKDAKGFQFIKEFIKVGKEQGSGWITYWWVRHGEKEPTLKKSFIAKIPGEDIFIGAGFYEK